MFKAKASESKSGNAQRSGNALAGVATQRIMSTPTTKEFTLAISVAMSSGAEPRIEIYYAPLQY
jgi:hypothetical protein